MTQKQYDNWLAVVKSPKVRWGQGQLHRVGTTMGGDVIDEYCVWGMYSLANTLIRRFFPTAVLMSADECGHVSREQMSHLMRFNDAPRRTRKEVIKEVIRLHDELVSDEV